MATTQGGFQFRDHPDFLRLWLGRGLSAIGSQIVAVAIAWQLYNLTNSALDLGLIGLAQFGPLFLATPIAGHVADSYDRRRIAAACQLISAAIALGLLFGSAGGWLSRGLIFAFVAVASLSRAFEFPALSSMVPQTVPRPALQQATALYSSAMQAALILGPALGGVLYLVSPLVAYGSAAACLVAAAVAVVGMTVTRPDRIREPVTVSTLFAGVGFLRARPELLGAMLLDVLAVAFGAATALLPIFARDILGTGPEGLGLLRAAPACGAVAMAVWLARRPVAGRAGWKMLAGITVYGLATLALAVSGSLVLATLALIVLGAADMVSVVVRQSLVQLRTPDEMRGRVGAVNAMMAVSANQLGEFRAGIVAALIGPVPAILLGGVCTLGIVALWTRLFPDVTRIDRLDGG
jgi:MFS family permease